MKLVRKAIRPATCGAAVLFAFACATGYGRAEESAKALAANALQECERAQVSASRADRQRALERGQEIAERAVSLDDRSSDAHFALFCNLGEQLRVDGERIPSPFGFRRMMKELDRTLELSPDHHGALASKGILLVRLPGFLGGDARRGEAMLERVVHEDPTAISSRLALADIYKGRGERTAAVALAAQALQLARGVGRPDKIAKAEAVLKELDASPSEIGQVLASTGHVGG